ncbi:hypothetical protein llap_2471 [Limosa lapponica baueri]|uniref:Uncharacterized protein n=1 Tax=Limosa lapponica baueri TaxID=1758121 RepID=A0A2I0UMD4_LIMLA|nr:hypothetical protein llap_2471 [Limosa lapponica baueri]
MSERQGGGVPLYVREQLERMELCLGMDDELRAYGSRTVHLKKWEVRQNCQEAYMDEQGDPGKTQTQKENIQKVDAGTGNLGGIQRACLGMQRRSQKSQSPPGAETESSGKGKQHWANFKIVLNFTVYGREIDPAITARAKLCFSKLVTASIPYLPRRIMALGSSRESHSQTSIAPESDRGERESRERVSELFLFSKSLLSFQKNSKGVSTPGLRNFGSQMIRVVQGECLGLVYSWAKEPLLQSCHGQRVAEGQIFPLELAMEGSSALTGVLLSDMKWFEKTNKAG